jgi:glutamate dehydrogenase/leucine dehydrogenase
VETIVTVFSAESLADHEQVVFVSDPESGLRAIIALHDTSLGPALGGCRLENPLVIDGVACHAVQAAREVA